MSRFLLFLCSGSYECWKAVNVNIFSLSRGYYAATFWSGYGTISVITHLWWTLLKRLPLSHCCYYVPLGLHELDAMNDQEVKDFRSKMLRISEERMQRVQMMTFTEWLQTCFSPQLESSAGTVITDGVDDWPADLKVTIHFDQSQVRVCNPVLKMLQAALCSACWSQWRRVEWCSFYTGMNQCNLEILIRPTFGCWLVHSITSTALQVFWLFLFLLLVVDIA